jgi:hypothetical protein
MLREPQEKIPCIGCGYCCMRNTCTFGVALHPDRREEPCPELEWNGRRYVCRLMARPGRMADFYKSELQSGGGCRSFENPWRQEVRERKAGEVEGVHSGTPWPYHPD